MARRILDAMELGNVRDSNHVEVRVGRIEKLVVSGMFAVVTAGIGWAWTTGNNQIASLSDNVHRLSEQQAVTNSRLDTLAVQLADIPGLMRQVAELQVQVSRNEQDIRDIERARKR